MTNQPDTQYHFWFSAKEKELLSHSKLFDAALKLKLPTFRKSEYTHMAAEETKPKDYDDYQYIGFGALGETE